MLKLVEPKVYLISKQHVNSGEISRFLVDEDLNWLIDSGVDSQTIVEMAGRVCYMSYGKGRKTNEEFIKHLVEVGHGSVLEHSVWSILITGVSRSFTHELVRHRHFSYSQLSQRYVDESLAGFIMPEIIAQNPSMHGTWTRSIEAAQTAYSILVDNLMLAYGNITDVTQRRKLARQAARSVLPNSTETKIFVTGNARAFRLFLEMRTSVHADLEMRKVALAILKLLKREAPTIFSDFTITQTTDGSNDEIVTVGHSKV
jgi:thymidylate synthase (FAD)